MRKVFYGWWIVLASVILCFIMGGTFSYGFTTFFNPIRSTFGWSAAITSIAFSLRGLETGALTPVVGFLVDKVESRKLMLFGWGITGLGFLWLSHINSLWAFYGSFLFLAIGTGFGSFVVTNTAIANWFVKKRSRAMALMYVGFGVSGTLVPLVAWAISHFGWRETLVIVAIVSWVIGLPLSLVFRHRPEQYGYLPDGESPMKIDGSTNMPDRNSPGEVVEQSPASPATSFTARAAMKTHTFWLFASSIFFQNMATSAVMVHIVPYLQSINIATTVAATAVTGLTLFSLIGRLGFGFLGDFTSKRYLIVIALAVQAIGLFLFSFVDIDRAWLIVLSLLLYASGFGGTIPVRPALQADYFGVRSFGTIFGWMMFFGMIGGIASPVVAGWVYDTTGSYRLAWQLLALTTVPAIPLMLLARPPAARRTIT